MLFMLFSKIFLRIWLLLSVFWDYFLFFSLKIIYVNCNLLQFSIIFCIIVPCLPFFEIIFYFFLWKLLMLYVICVIFDDLLYNCPLFTFFAIFFLWKLLLLCYLCYFRCLGGGPILGEFLFSVKDGTLLDKF